MAPLFSIIIPVYNVAPYLRECLISVLAQTFANWEAICVDDGSTDGSGAILDEYAAKDSRFHVIHQANAGVSAARNAALDRLTDSDGYVWFVDADDMVHPESLLFFIKQFERFPKAKMLLFRGYLESASTPCQWSPLDACSMRYVSQVNSVSYDYAHASAWMAVFRKEAIGSLRFEPFSMSEDTLFIETALWRIGSSICGDQPVYFYRTHQRQATGAANLKKVREWLLVEHRLADHLEDHSGQWRRADMQDFFVKRRNQLWYTYKNMLFRLPISDMRKCINLWTTLQQRRQKLYRETAYRRLVVKTIRFFPSALLLKALVLDLPRLKAAVMGIHHNP